MRLRIIELPREQTLLVFDLLTQQEHEEAVMIDMATTIGNNVQGGTVLIFEGEVDLQV